MNEEEEEEEGKLLSGPPDLLKKKKKKRRLGLGFEKVDHPATTRGTRKPIKFGAEFCSSGSNSDTENGEPHRPRLPANCNGKDRFILWRYPRRKNAHPSQFQVDYDKEIEAVKDKLARRGEEVVEYSDYEEDVAAAMRRKGEAERNGWRPAFLDRQQGPRSRSIPPPPAAPVPVPATPSLIKALDRIAVAQWEGFGLSCGHGDDHDAHGAGQGQKEAEPWDEFWREVKTTTTTTRRS